MGTFLDFGNIYGEDGEEDSDLRYSVGVSAVWLSPFGALSFSVAQPLNDQGNDDVEQFQFTFGSGF
jgi:outer membrane protein insertion porin family